MLLEELRIAYNNVDSILEFTHHLWKRAEEERLLVEPPAAQEPALGLSLDKVEWPSMPSSKPSRVKYDVYKNADGKFVQGDYQPHRIPSGLDRLKVTYGCLDRRPDSELDL